MGRSVIVWGFVISIGAYATALGGAVPVAPATWLFVAGFGVAFWGFRIDCRAAEAEARQRVEREAMATLGETFARFMDDEQAAWIAGRVARRLTGGPAARDDWNDRTRHFLVSRN